MTTLPKSILRNALGLGLFAMVTAGLIAITQQLTADAIQQQEARAQAGALLEIIPPELHSNDLLSDTFTVSANPDLGLETDRTGYRARRNGQVSGVLLPVTAPDGYSGAIHLMVGITRDGTLLGVRVLEHKETPGLGDKIELQKSDWIRTFEGKSLGNPPAEQWRVEKRGGDFDQFTGATITPNAVVTAVHGALDFFAAHRQALLGKASQVPPQAPGDVATELSDER